MNMKKIIVALLLMLTMLACLPVSAAEERKLTLDRVVQINDMQLILEFSEPVAINYHDVNRGPYCAVRIRKANQGVTRVQSGQYQNQYLQWDGSLQYVDDKHDRLVWTMTTGKIDANSITDIRNYNGILQDYKEQLVSFTIEEVPYDQSGGYTNNAIDNVTTEDGEVYLTPTRPAGYEAVNMPIEVNFNYKVDLSNVESVTRPETYDHALLEQGAGTAVEETPAVAQVVKNDPLILAAILGGGALVCAALIVIAVVIAKKRKAA